MIAPQISEKVDISTPAFKANPFPFYARLRAECPVYETTFMGKHPLWLITRYDDVIAVLKDDKRFVKNKRNAMTAEQLKNQPWVPGFFKPLQENMLDLDAPAHGRLRGLVHKAFTPRRIEEMHDKIQVWTHALIDAVERKGEMDFVNDFALPLPLMVISDLLGIPQKDIDKFHRWSKTATSVTSERDFLFGIPHIVMLMRYLRGQFRERRKQPQDDLMTALVQAEEAGDKLSEDEMLAMAIILLIAGHETTVNLISLGMLELLQHPDQLTLLREKPELAKTAIEEISRFTTPVDTGTERYAAEDITLHGVTIPRGDMVFAILASANRDESMFPNGDTFDITREPQKHMTFGHGIHYCLGAPLARMEGEIAFRTVLERLPNLQLKVAPDKLKWRKSVVIRGIEALPVTF